MNKVFMYLAAIFIGTVIVLYLAVMIIVYILMPLNGK